jgi:hypothetical protein
MDSDLDSASNKSEKKEDEVSEYSYYSEWKSASVQESQDEP